MGRDESVEWSAESSAVYRQLASVAVPAREEQMATLLSLLPFGCAEAFHVVELASGEGMLSQAILEAFPAATVLALDGEESMRQATAARLQPYGERAQVVAFDIASILWYSELSSADVVVSSLCVHHLHGQGKRDLFTMVHDCISARGCRPPADLVLPQREEVREFFAATWDRSAREQSTAQTGDTALFDLFEREHWNYYTQPRSVRPAITLVRPVALAQGKRIRGRGLLLDAGGTRDLRWIPGAGWRWAERSH